jgi:uncharacterized protein
MTRKQVKRCFYWGLPAAGYLWLVGCAHLADRFILYPQTGPAEIGAAELRTVPWAGGQVEVAVARSPEIRGRGRGREPALWVLLLQGNADRGDRWAADVAGGWGGRAVEVWGMNYPGYGGSTGPAKLASLTPAALAVYDEMARQAKGRPILIQSSSVGATVALAVAARRPVAALTIEKPPALRQMIIGEHGWWNLWLLAWPVSWQVPAELDTLANGALVKTPAVFVLAEQDEVTAPKYQKMVYDAYAGPKRAVDVPGPHNSGFGSKAEREFAQGMEWLWGMVVEGPAPATTTRP